MSDNARFNRRDGARGEGEPLPDFAFSLRLIDSICDEFEAEWKSSHDPPPHLASFLTRAPESQRARLLKELVGLELLYRRLQGNQDPWQVLLANNPEIAESLQRLRDEWDTTSSYEPVLGGGDLPTKHEQPSSGFRVRCPHCCESVALTPDAALSEIECHSCGNSFSLIDETKDTIQAETVSQIGHFELVQRLGLGSFGSVWKARDTILDRTVAVKIPRKGQVDVEEAERFLREAQAAAQLNHPNIVRIHEVGRAGDLLYIVSEFLRGIALSESLAERRYAPREAAHIAAKIAGALHHAHSCGVIHRDLKAGNILLDGQNEPHILDFGLAKREGREVTMTIDGVILGTPAYMSPEQAKGDVKTVDRRTDIYSLGVILFELLTGERPFRGTFRMLLHKKVNEEPPSPRAMDPTIPRDLETICLKCLARLPEHRYTSAEDVAKDLLCWLAGRPISARPISPPERFLRWCYRRPAEAALVFAIALGSAGILWLLLINMATNRRVVKMLVDNYVTTDVENQSAALHQIQNDLGSFEKEITRRFDKYPPATREGLLLRLAVLTSQPELANNVMETYLTMDDPLARSVDNSLLLSELKRYTDMFVERLWHDVLTPDENISRRRWLRSAAALAAFDHDQQQWHQLADKLVDGLLADKSTDWTSDFQSVSRVLVPHLEHYFHQGTEEQQLMVARVFAIYLADRPLELVRVLYRARPDQFDYLLHAIDTLPSKSREQALLEMKRFAMDDHCMAVPGEEGEKQVQQRANAVLALVKLGQASTVWRLFAYQPDPRLQSYLTCRASHVAVPTALLIDRMYTESDPDALYTLILLLGRFDPNKAIDPGVLARLERWLWDTYENHRDSGVHAAVHWVLRRWGHGEALDARDLRLAKLGATEGCNWYHNALGQMMVVIRHPSEVRMGMEDGEQQTKLLAPRQLATPQRPFAIAATETTLRHYRRYRSEGLDVDALSRPERPVYEKSLYEAFGFCDWLTRIERRTDEGLVPKQFDPVKTNQPDLVVNLETSVYRLPTEVEWEYACRAGSITSRFFGGAYTMLLNEYAIVDSTKESMPVGQNMPNRLGLFDTYGNVSEWTVDAFELPQSLYDRSPLRTISRDVPRVVRGGGFSSNHQNLRSAFRVQIVPYYLHPGTGFRVARTMIPDGA